MRGKKSRNFLDIISKVSKSFEKFCVDFISWTRLKKSVENGHFLPQMGNLDWFTSSSPKVRFHKLRGAFNFASQQPHAFSRVSILPVGQKIRENLAKNNPIKVLFTIFQIEKSKLSFVHFKKIFFTGICTKKWRYQKSQKPFPLSDTHNT